MLRFARLPIRRRLRRGLQFLCILVVSACSEECEDPSGPDFQAVVGGRVTVNGEGIGGLPVSSGQYGSTTTSERGTYSMNIQSDSETMIPCVRMGGIYGVAQDALLVLDCPVLGDGDRHTANFAFLHTPPTLQITSPEDGASLPTGASTQLRVALGGTLSLNGFPPILPANVAWTSSLDGSLGDWLPLAPGSASLSDGSHTITATFIDLLGVAASDEVTVQVAASGGPNEPPVAAIQSPPSGVSFDFGTSIQFTGTGTDPEDGALTGASLVWTSSQGGQIGTGESFTRVMAEGSHNITLTVTDSDGESDSETVPIHIRSESGTGSIQGVVSIGGEPLASIAVDLTGAATASTTTDTQGAYSFPDLGPGTYTITITPPPGADIQTQQTVTLGDGEILTVNFTG